MIKSLAALPLLLVVPSLASAKPTATPGPLVEPTYALPVAGLKVSLALTLTSCSPIAAEPKVTLTPVAGTTALPPAGGKGATPERLFALDLAAMQSWNKTRELSVELYPNRTIKSVNGGVADRTGAIITNLIKAAAGVALLADNAPRSRLGACTLAVAQSLDRRNALKEAVKKAKADLLLAKPADTKPLQERI